MWTPLGDFLPRARTRVPVMCIPAYSWNSVILAFLWSFLTFVCVDLFLLPYIVACFSFLLQEIHSVWNTGLLASRDDRGKNSWWKGGPVESGCPLLWVPCWETTFWSKKSRGDLPQDIEGKQMAWQTCEYEWICAAGHQTVSKPSLFHSSCFDTVFVIQVEYTYPTQTNISAGAKDLVASLLKHNPMHRLPIQGVLTHPWVVESSTKKPTTINVQSSQWAFWSPAPPVWGWSTQNNGFMWHKITRVQLIYQNLLGLCWTQN